jgi:hypothetical protein
VNLTNSFLLALTAGALALAGCGKPAAPPPRPPGVVDLGDLQRAFPTPPPEIQTSLDRLRYSTRYRQFDAAQAELDKISRAPNLTDAQKKAVNEVIAQVKEAMSTSPTRPAH